MTSASANTPWPSEDAGIAGGGEVFLSGDASPRCPHSGRTNHLVDGRSDFVPWYAIRKRRVVVLARELPRLGRLHFSAPTSS